jgi:hypothetical protein
MSEFPVFIESSLADLISGRDSNDQQNMGESIQDTKELGTEMLISDCNVR